MLFPIVIERPFVVPVPRLIVPSTASSPILMAVLLMVTPVPPSISTPPDVEPIWTEPAPVPVVLLITIPAVVPPSAVIVIASATSSLLVRDILCVPLTFKSPSLVTIFVWSRFVTPSTFNVPNITVFPLSPSTVKTSPAPSLTATLPVVLLTVNRSFTPSFTVKSPLVMSNPLVASTFPPIVTWPVPVVIVPSPVVIAPSPIVSAPPSAIVK